MTAVEFLFNELWEAQKSKLIWHSILEKAKEIEKQQIEISDEEIDKQAEVIEFGINRMFFKTGAKWYRKQLKSKQ